MATVLRCLDCNQLITDPIGHKCPTPMAHIERIIQEVRVKVSSEAAAFFDMPSVPGVINVVDKEAE